MKTRLPKEEHFSDATDFAQRSDEQLVLAYRKRGESALFSELVSRYERELFNYLRRFLGDAALAEDVFQATFLQVHVKQHMFESGRKFRPWLYTIATNQAIDAQRRNKRHRRLSLDEAQRSAEGDAGALAGIIAGSADDPAGAADANEQAEWVRGAVDGLPDSLRSAVKLVYFGGMKYRDAANELSVPVGTVKSRLHSAIQRLGQSWRDMQPERNP